MRALALCALAACSYPEKVLIDAFGTPFGCLNQPLPTTADNPIIISSNKLYDAIMGTPIGGASVIGHLTGLPSPVFTIQTNAQGGFNRSQATGGSPIDFYLEISANGYETSYYWPPHALSHDWTFMENVLFTSDEANGFAGLAQVTFDVTKSQMFLRVADCNDTPVAGVTVTTSPAGSQVRYFNGKQPSATATATDNMGLVLVANLPPGNVAVNATGSGMSWRTVNVQSVAGTIIAPTIQP